MARTTRKDAPEEAVDLGVLRTATSGDRDIMQHLAELYLSDTDLTLRALEDALATKDMDRIRRIGRSLEESSRQIGAPRAAAIFKDLEQAAKAGEMERIKDVIVHAWAEFDRVRKVLDDLR